MTNQVVSKGHFIAGKWQPTGGDIFTSVNPANGDVIYEAKEAGDTEINAAMKAGQEAFKTWSKLSFEERLAYIEAFKAVVEKRQEELACAVSHEMGKVRWEAEGEIKGVIGKIAVSVKAYHERTGTTEIPAGGLTNKLQHRPHGVMAVYGPYNFPAHLPNGHIIPALLAGNTIVFKPSELTPYVGQLMVEFWEEAGLPAGVVQLVQGAKNTGIALSKHEDLSGILFTGSVATGTALHKQCAGKLDMILALELGGHNPLVVWDAKNIDAAIELVIQSAFITTGQRCTCARRLIVPNNSIGETFVQKLAEKVAETITTGAWDDASAPFMGPLVSKQAADHAASAYQALLDGGAQPVLALERNEAEDGAFINPMIVDVTEMQNAPDEEIFAPLLKVTRVENFEAAIEEANNTRYGLSAGLLTDDQALIDQFMRDIKAGIISINRPTTGASGAMPFGGCGISGNHRAAAYYAADYCAWPMAAQITDKLEMPTSLPVGSAATK